MENDSFLEEKAFKLVAQRNKEKNIKFGFFL